jgi:hypothetical protein
MEEYFIIKATLKPLSKQVNYELLSLPSCGKYLTTLEPNVRKQKYKT